MNGPGQGSGGEAPEQAHDTGVDKTKLKSMLGKGQYVGAYSMGGDPPKGAAAAEYADVHQAAQSDAMDALQRQKVPATHRDFVRDYFDSIRAGEKR